MHFIKTTFLFKTIKNSITTNILTINSKTLYFTFKYLCILTQKSPLPHMVSLNSQECGWTLAHDVFAVDFSVSLKPLRLQSVHDLISLSAASSVTPVMLSWDFGDFSSRVNTTGTGMTTATHKYSHPGRYALSLMAWAGHKEVREKKQEIT